MANRRWIRLDVTWDDSEWVGLMEPASQLAWIKLLCYVKAKGVGGSVKAMGPRIAAKKWDLPVRAVEEMLKEAQKDGALSNGGGEWDVVAWDEYQKPDKKAAERMRRMRDRQAG